MITDASVEDEAQMSESSDVSSDDEEDDDEEQAALYSDFLLSVGETYRESDEDSDDEDSDDEDSDDPNDPLYVSDAIPTVF